jgi:hypothetical protein
MRIADCLAGHADDHGVAFADIQSFEFASAGDTDKRAHDRLSC